MLSTFIFEGNVKFQLGINENKDVIFFPIQIHGPKKILPMNLMGEYPRLRTCELGSKIKEKEKLDKTKSWKL